MTDEERRKARREAGLYDRIIATGKRPGLQAIGIVILLVLVLLSIWLR